ncbi:hypothetical protein LCGC14_1685800 [marine sediment metagenome]|uniref:Uncharacterized protein n=1 Tax=marine sediment metagenome TaxID=412755 RepID=A0A0F9KMB3_9ZZZZ
MPTAGRARDLARKTLCAGQMHVYGVGVTSYLTQYDSYPHTGTGGIDSWPKFHSILQAMGVEPTNIRSNGMPDYQLEPDELIDANVPAVCPSMDIVRLWEYIEQALLTGGDCPNSKASDYPATIAYQWNVCLRAAGHSMPLFPNGKWVPYCWSPWEPVSYDWWEWDNTRQIDFVLELGDGNFYITQAAHPREIQNPGQCAEAWDSFDVDSTPYVQFSSWSVENLAPGWHVGPQSEHASGWALLNGGRHLNGPNILYADHSVRSDANRQLDKSDLPNWAYGSMNDCKLVSWDDYEAVWGTMGHIVPRKEIRTELPR